MTWKGSGEVSEWPRRVYCASQRSQVLLPVWVGRARQLELGKGTALEYLDLNEDVPAENDRGDEMSELGGD